VWSRPSSRASADAWAATTPVFRSVSASWICSARRFVVPSPSTRVIVPVSSNCALLRLDRLERQDLEQSALAASRSLTRVSSSDVAASAGRSPASSIGSRTTVRLLSLARNAGPFLDLADEPSVACATAWSKAISPTLVAWAAARRTRPPAPRRARRRRHDAARRSKDRTLIDTPS
jgi:hypothetical protein